MFPDNIVRATFQQVQTKQTKEPKRVDIENSTLFELILNGTHYELKQELEYKDGMNVLGEWVFCPIHQWKVIVQPDFSRFHHILHCIRYHVRTNG